MLYVKKEKKSGASEESGVYVSWGWQASQCFILFILIFFYLVSFRERRRAGEREGEKHQCVRETSISFVLYAPQLGTKLATQACSPSWH